MIRIARGEEPEALREERRRRRALCRLIEMELRPGEMKLDEGYQVAADALCCAQGPLCAYCEDNIRETGVPLDHFRPKGAVHDGQRKRVHGGYWWLAWSWENLFRACGTCNDQNHKGNQFPVLDEAERLAPMRAPPGDERAVLIDPAREDPMDFIEYRVQGVDVDGHAQWKPLPRRGIDEAMTRRALATIEGLGLNKGALLGFYNDHVGALAARVELVRAAIASGVEAEVMRRWRELRGGAFSRSARFQALAWDYLRQEFDDAVLVRWGLELPRPGAALGAHASVDTPRLDGLDELTCLEVEALGQQSPDTASIRDLLERVLRTSPRSRAELAAFFRRTEATIGGHLSALQVELRVVLDGDLWCCQPAAGKSP